MSQRIDQSGNLSFLPEDYIQRRVEQRTNLICLTLFAVVLVGVVGAYLVTKGQRVEVLRRQKQISADYAEAAKRLAQLTELRDRKQQLLSKAQITATLIEPVPRSNLLAELINRMPGTLSLSECSLKSKKLASPKRVTPQNQSALANARAAAQQKKQNPEPAQPAAPRYLVTVNLVGLAPTDIQVAQYMASLARCPLLDEVDLVYSEAGQVNDLTMRRFKIVMTLNPNADIRVIDPLIADPPPDLPRHGFGRPALQASVALPGADESEGD